MKIVGIEKSSFIDYPSNICSIIFTGGCNFRCPYCHNSSAVNNIESMIREEEVINFLKKRKRFVEAVCISGGEPTLQKNLYDFICRIKEEDFLVKLDTNGTNPSLLKKLIHEKLVNYVAMDIKAPLNKYSMIAQTNVHIDDIKESINILLENKVDYEFRTTVCRELLTMDDIITIAHEIKGCTTYALQNFRDGETVLAGKNKFTPYTAEELNDIEKEISPLLNKVIIR